MGVDIPNNTRLDKFTKLLSNHPQLSSMASIIKESTEEDKLARIYDFYLYLLSLAENDPALNEYYFELIFSWGLNNAGMLLTRERIRIILNDMFDLNIADYDNFDAVVDYIENDEDVVSSNQWLMFMAETLRSNLKNYYDLVRLINDSEKTSELKITKPYYELSEFNTGCLLPLIITFFTTILIFQGFELSPQFVLVYFISFLIFAFGNAFVPIIPELLNDSFKDSNFSDGDKAKVISEIRARLDSYREKLSSGEA